MFYSLSTTAVLVGIFRHWTFYIGENSDSAFVLTLGAWHWKLP